MVNTVCAYTFYIPSHRRMLGFFPPMFHPLWSGILFIWLCDIRSFRSFHPLSLVPSFTTSHTLLSLFCLHTWCYLFVSIQTHAYTRVCRFIYNTNKWKNIIAWYLCWNKNSFRNPYKLFISYMGCDLLLYVRGISASFIACAGKKLWLFWFSGEKNLCLNVLKCMINVHREIIWT